MFYKCCILRAYEWKYIPDIWQFTNKVITIIKLSRNDLFIAMRVVMWSKHYRGH